MADYHPFTPDWTLRPGHLLLEVMRERDMTPLQVALRGKLAPRTVRRVLGGKQKITPRIASALGNVLGTSAAFWVNAQANYDTDLARGAKDVSEEHEHD